MWREWIFWDFAASPLVRKRVSFAFLGGRKPKGRLLAPFADEVGEVFAGLNGQGVPSLLHVAVGDHGCAASPFGFGGSSFSSVVAAQPELRLSGTGKAL